MSISGMYGIAVQISMPEFSRFRSEDIPKPNSEEVALQWKRR